MDAKANETIEDLQRITKKLDKKFPNAKIGFKAKLGEKWYRKSRLNKNGTTSLWVQDKFRFNINYSF